MIIMRVEIIYLNNDIHDYALDEIEDKLEELFENNNLAEVSGVGYGSDISNLDIEVENEDLDLLFRFLEDQRQDLYITESTQIRFFIDNKENIITLPR